VVANNGNLKCDANCFKIDLNSQYDAYSYSVYVNCLFFTLVSLINYIIMV
jgi:hypothetical protein